MHAEELNFRLHESVPYSYMRIILVPGVATTYVQDVSEKTDMLFRLAPQDSTVHLLKNVRQAQMGVSFYLEHPVV